MEASLRFPPFPSLTAADRPLLTYSDWRTRGIWIWNGHPPDKVRPSRDSNHETLVDLEIGHDPNNQTKDLARAQARLQRLADRKRETIGMPVRLARADCLKIGQEDACWREPEATFRMLHDESEAPFNRRQELANTWLTTVLSATRDFLYSRHEELQFVRSKRLFDVMRNALGVRSDFAGAHWPGKSGQAYDGPSRSNLTVADSAYEGSIVDPYEVCVLLRKTVDSVRGFLALARREAEASWDIDPALKLADITSAYLAYIVVHRVFPEAPLHDNFIAASNVARTAFSRLLQAKALEDQLVDPQGFNGLLWSAARPDGEEPAPESQIAGKETGADPEDGGWTTSDYVRPHTGSSSSAAAVSARAGPLLNDSGPVLRTMLYERRKILKVEAVNDMGPDFADYHRLTTIPAPWTQEEGWRLHRPEVNYGNENATEGSTFTSNAEPTIDDTPAILPIVVRLQGRYLEDPQVLVGCGLRGAYRQLRYGNHQIWIMKIKDYILPSFWQSAQVPRPRE